VFSRSFDTTKYYHIFSTTKSRAKIGRAGPGPQFYVNFGSGQVESLHLWVGLGPVKKIGPASNYVQPKQAASAALAVVRCLSGVRRVRVL